MVQSLDLARISIVQSMDFMDFMAILRFSTEDLLLNPQTDLDLRTSSSLSGCQFDGENRDCLLHNLCSSDRLGLADGSDLLSERHLPYFLFYSSHHIYHEIIHVFGVNPWISGISK